MGKRPEITMHQFVFSFSSIVVFTREEIMLLDVMQALPVFYTLQQLKTTIEDVFAILVLI